MTTFLPSTEAPENLRDGLLRDFHSARADLIGARVAVRVKDTPANRRTVASAIAAVDNVLDLYLAIR